MIEWRDSSATVFSTLSWIEFCISNHLGSTYNNPRMSANIDAQIFQMLNFCPCQKKWHPSPKQELEEATFKGVEFFHQEIVPAPRSCCNVRFFISTTGTQTLPKNQSPGLMDLAEPCWALALLTDILVWEFGDTGDTLYSGLKTDINVTAS